MPSGALPAKPSAGKNGRTGRRWPDLLERAGPFDGGATGSASWVCQPRSAPRRSLSFGPVVHIESDQAFILAAVCTLSLGAVRMPVPSHGLFCQSRVFPISCWYCDQRIHILRCSCGSTVLFDALGWPWPLHRCPEYRDLNGVGGGDGSVGVPDSLEHTARASSLPERPSALPAVAIESVAPSPGPPLEVVAVIREIYTSTKRTRAIDDLSDFGKTLLGLDTNAQYRQVTLVQNDSRPNKSYTALVSEKDLRGFNQGMLVGARICARSQGSSPLWVVSRITAL